MSINISKKKVFGIGNLGLSPTSAQKKKTEQIFIRREKSKSNIQMIMNEIYQEEEKNSKIVKYLTKANHFRSLNQVPNNANIHYSFIRTPKTKLNSLTISNPTEQTLQIIPLNSNKVSIKSVKSIEIPETPKYKPKKFDLVIEDPSIINIYQNSIEKPQRNSRQNSIFVTNGTPLCFDDELRRKKIVLKQYISANTDVFAKIKRKQQDNEKLVFGDKHKKHLNVKEESIKRRFMKLWNTNNENLKSLENNNNNIINDSYNSPSLMIKTQNNLHKQSLRSNRPPTNIKTKLKENIQELEEKPVKKLTTVEKIKEKYTFSTILKKRIDKDLIEIIKKMGKTSPINKKLNFNATTKNESFINQKENFNEIISFMPFLSPNECKTRTNESPQKKFELFYNDLMGYYQNEMKDRGDVQKNISHQVKVYDEELKKINEKLFEFNANLDKEFNKEVIEGRFARFSTIRRNKRKR